MQAGNDVPTRYQILRFLGRLQFLRQGVRARVIDAISNRLEVAGAFTVPLENFVYRGAFGNYLDRSIFFYGGYESAIAAAIADFLKRRGPESILYDVGANVGIHALLASRHAKAVHAFEPYPKVMTIMQAHLADNGVRNVIVHPVALGLENSQSAFNPGPDSNMGWGCFVAAPDAGTIQLPVAHGDDYVRRQNLPLPDVIKIDTEGFDAKVVIGLRETIAAGRPAILLESNAPVKADAAAFGGFGNILPPDYRIYAFSGPKPVMLLFSEPAATYHLDPDPAAIANADTILLLPKEMMRPN